MARFPEAIGVRDSKNPDGPKLLLTRNAFRTILDELKH
ncbi:regulator [Actinomadura verrucosospora]|uniref:Regulator n=1 Tax=Actinomadura verrucosospora TaxID=46165 RepID=A0A7D3W3A1_ACTVE|nr:regulator [Actinomadura verrucosospora]